MQKTKEFQNEFSKLPLVIQKRFNNQFKRVEKDPYGLGKPLGARWVRELKNGKFRVYYVIFDHEVMVMFAGVSEKKNQKMKIKVIKENIHLLKELLNRKDFKSKDLKE